MTQLWKIRGQIYTHGQLMEMKRQGLDPRKDDIEMKFITKPKTEKKSYDGSTLKKEEVKVTTAEVAVPQETTGTVETNAEEFERLKKERAWKNAEKKDRYNELKALLKK